MSRTENQGMELKCQCRCESKKVMLTNTALGLQSRADCVKYFRLFRAQWKT